MNHNPYSAPTATLGEAPRRAQETGKENYHKTARAHLALACLAGFVLLTMLGVFLTSSEFPAGALPGLILLGLLTSVHVLIWRGARKRNNAARIGSLIIGFLSLAGFPIGTLIGIYLIVNSWSEWREPPVYADTSTLLQGWPTA